MIFNTSQAELSLTGLYDVLKIMCKNRNLIWKQIHPLEAVEKHIEGVE